MSHFCLQSSFIRIGSHQSSDHLSSLSSHYSSGLSHISHQSVSDLSTVILHQITLTDMLPYKSHSQTCCLTNHTHRYAALQITLTDMLPYKSHSQTCCLTNHTHRQLALQITLRYPEDILPYKSHTILKTSCLTNHTQIS